MKLLHKELEVRNLDDLEKLSERKTRRFPRLGVKSPELLLQRIENAKLQSNRVMLIEAETIAKRVADESEEKSSNQKV